MRLGDQFVCQNLKSGKLMSGSYTICSYGKIEISWAIPRR